MMKRIHTILLTASAVALFLSLTAMAAAVPQAKLNQAKAVKAEIDALDTKVEQASEDYNEARNDYNEAIGAREKVDIQLAKTTQKLAKVQTHLSSRADSMYRQGPLGIFDVLLGASTFEDFASTWDLLNAMNEDDAEAVGQLDTLKEETTTLQKKSLAQERKALDKQEEMRSQEASIKSQLALRKQKLKGIESEIATLKKQEEEAARRQAAAQAAAARASSGSGGSGSSGGGNFPPPKRAPRSEVVSIAKQYLGARYVWAAAGPNTFDCSGFTMYVYRQVGVSLPHSSRAQINSGERVSKSDLEPGDLVFFGSPIHHVGMYVGGGMMIHSPQTGDVVKYSSAFRGDYAGACRP